MIRLLLLAVLIVGVMTGGAERASTEACRSAVIVSTTTAKVLRGLHLHVNSVVADGHGGWFVANSRPKHLRRDGSVDETPAREVALLALSSSRLYFSGSSGVRVVRASDGRATSFVPRARIDGPIMVAVWNRFVFLGCSSRWSYCPADSGVFDGRTGKPVHKFAFDEVLSAVRSPSPARSRT